MNCMCSHCLGQANFIEKGHDEKGRTFKLYFCPTCKNYTRNFLTSERETVDDIIRAELSLEPKALSDNIRQLRMFPAARVSD